MTRFTVRTKQETKTRFDESPVVKITGEEIDLFGKGLGIQQIRREMPKWAKENGIIRDDVKNQDTGWDNIAITPKGIKESMEHGAGEGKIQALAALPELIKNGIHLCSGPANNNRQIGMISHVFAGKLRQGEKATIVGFIIKEDMNGRRFFNHELIKTKSLGGVPSKAGAAPKHGGRLPDTRQGLIRSILSDYLGINSEE